MTAEEENEIYHLEWCVQLIKDHRTPAHGKQIDCISFLEKKLNKIKKSQDKLKEWCEEYPTAGIQLFEALGDFLNRDHRKTEFE